MAEAKRRGMDDIEVDIDNLYKEETFTDFAVASIRRATPVTADGSVDPSRPVIYTGATSLMTEAGSIPLSFEIEAKDLKEAFSKFPDGMKKAYDDMVAEVQRMRREQASRIVAPTGPVPGLGGSGGAPRGRITL